MRAFVQCSLISIGFAAILSDRALAQPVEEPEEIIVRGKPLSQFRLEIEQAHDEMIKLFNEANADDDTDVQCRDEAPTGSRIPQRACWSRAQDRAGANGAREVLGGLLMSAGKGSGPGGPQVTAEIGIAEGLSNAGREGSTALVQFEKEWARVMSTNRQFYDAVVKYREFENDLNRAQGKTVRIPIPVFTFNGPQCEASTYTEYEQLGNVARVSGTVSISACPAGTTGKFTLVARVRNEAGAITPIEFSEAWQRDDAQDHIFSSDYPIGDDVLLDNVRVRNLTCSCASITQ